MSKYFDGYASFDYEEMSKEKLIFELKEKIQYIGVLKKEIIDLQKQFADKDNQIKSLKEILNEKENSKPLIW